MCVLLYASGDMLQLPVKNNMVQLPFIHICVWLCSVVGDTIAWFSQMQWQT
jgi:hypothetical protein